MTVFVHAELHGLAGRERELREVLREHAAALPRAVAYEPIGGAPGELVLDAWWPDEQALRAHYATPEYARYRDRVGELLARPSDVRVHVVERSYHPSADPSADPARQG